MKKRYTPHFLPEWLQKPRFYCILSRAFSGDLAVVRGELTEDRGIPNEVLVKGTIEKAYLLERKQALVFIRAIDGMLHGRLQSFDQCALQCALLIGIVPQTGMVASRRLARPSDGRRLQIVEDLMFLLCRSS